MAFSTNIQGHHHLQGNVNARNPAWQVCLPGWKGGQEIGHGRPQVSSQLYIWEWAKINKPGDLLVHFFLRTYQIPFCVASFDPRVTCMYIHICIHTYAFLHVYLAFCPFISCLLCLNEIVTAGECVLVAAALCLQREVAGFPGEGSKLTV